MQLASPSANYSVSQSVSRLVNQPIIRLIFLVSRLLNQLFIQSNIRLIN